MATVIIKAQWDPEGDPHPELGPQGLIEAVMEAGLGLYDIDIEVEDLD